MEIIKYLDPLLIVGVVIFLVLHTVNLIWLVIRAPKEVRFSTFKRVHRAFLGSIGFVLFGLCTSYQKVEKPIGSNLYFANIGAMIGSVAFIYGFFWPPTEH